MRIERTPLETWVKQKIGLSDTPLTMDALRAWQLDRLNQLLSYIRVRSPFYRLHLQQSTRTVLTHLAELARLPFTTADDLREQNLDFLCVSRDDIARIVTLQSSGTTANPKRLFFTRDDLELTIDFFHYGMTTFTKPGQTVLILMPGETPGSIGDLLVKALTRMNAVGIPYGPIRDVSDAIESIMTHKPACLVGIPSQVLALARHPDRRRIPAGTIQNILLSTDYVPSAIVRELESAWYCRVFNHYGMTEMGLGGAVECASLNGCHLREADLYFEIVDPDTGKTLPDGHWGEVVFTTLTRRGMPLLRYRTGDLARFLTEPCPCGTILKRMDRVRGRLAGMVKLKTNDRLSISDLDEAIFAVPGVLHFLAAMKIGAKLDRLDLVISLPLDRHADIVPKVAQAVQAVPAVEKALAENKLVLNFTTVGPEVDPTTGTAKRTIHLSREDRHESSI
jgi:phenylacetate-CoA ligase